ncbi:MAG: Ferrochelatase [Deltaproteobacteria bacterium]|nr:Ferrochelatase [Deltaproteobacteria bacterium]
MSALAAPPYDSVLLIGFGGPTNMREVRPFLANVLRGRPVPPERVETVVHHYELIGGRSPFNKLTFRQARALAAQLRADGKPLPVFVGLRCWRPYLHETLERMVAKGRQRAVGLIMAPHQSEASSGRYEREVTTARERVGAGAPLVDYVADWHAHPLFIEAVSDHVRAAMERVPAERRQATTLVFSAHSIPTAMAAASPYVEQITNSARLVAARLAHAHWSIAYQSRSGSPREPWLGPDITEVIPQLAADGCRALVVVPIGFVCDHVEVLYDLDIEARQIAEQAGIYFARAATVSDHPGFIRALADMVRQRIAAPAAVGA